MTAPFAGRRQPGRIIAATALAFAALSCSDPADDAMQRWTIEHDGITREYFVHVPPGSGIGAPLVIALHGYTSTATGFEAAHDLNDHADASGYVIVYPQGSHFVARDESGQRYRVTNWNDLAANLPATPAGPHCAADAYRYPCPPECGTCGRCAWTGCYDDVGLIGRIIDAVQAEFATDPRRTYLLGVSNGGMLALTLGCRMPERFAAVAPVVAQLAPGRDCAPAIDLPMLHLYGGQDDTVRADGGFGADGFRYTSARDTAARWAAALQCDARPAPWTNRFAAAAGVSCSAFGNCRVPGHEVVSCGAADGGHDWPGQRLMQVSPTCVTPAQADSMPDQPPCPATGDLAIRAGMDLVWDFMHRYERTDR